jgi:NTP pyrophosphatase (non-canonical NTP hydrolase)
MNELSAITDELLEFRDQRDWAQFHDSKNLALAISIEAAELNELYLWKNTLKDIESVDREKLKDELADIIAYALLLAEKNDFDVIGIVRNKMKKNAAKYPVEKSKGSAKKYTEL